MAIPKWNSYPEEPSLLGAIEMGRTKPPAEDKVFIPMGPPPAPPNPELTTNHDLSMQSATALLLQARRRARAEAEEEE